MEQKTAKLIYVPEYHTNRCQNIQNSTDGVPEVPGSRPPFRKACQQSWEAFRLLPKGCQKSGEGFGIIPKACRKPVKVSRNLTGCRDFGSTFGTSRRGARLPGKLSGTSDGLPELPEAFGNSRRAAGNPGAVSGKKWLKRVKFFLSGASLLPKAGDLCQVVFPD